MADATKGISEEELKALIASEIQAAITYDQTEQSKRRTQAWEYLRGEMNDTPAMTGRSHVVSTDTADTIGWMLPGTIRVFTASEQMVKYEATEPGDEAFNDQATDYINYLFWKDNPGYRILWDGCYDALAHGNGIVKHWWDDSEECEYHEFSGMTGLQIELLGEDPAVEIVGQKEGEPQLVVDPASGQEMPLETFDLKVKRVTRNGRLRFASIAPDCFLINKEAETIENYRFCAHEDETKTRSDLIEMGFKKDIVDALSPMNNLNTYSEERLAREGFRDGLPAVGHRSTDIITLFECYVKADKDGDGIAETLRVYYAGQPGAGELLDWEVWEDDVPFSDIPCEPVPHQREARSIVDKTADIQRIKTVLTRQMLDNLYWQNVPMQEAELGTVVNPEMLTTPKFGGVIWRKKGSQPVVPHVTPFVGDKVLVALQHFNEVIEKRTGVSRSTMALDPEALVNQTATATNKQADAAYSQVELVARNMAELGWTRVFKQALKLVVKHQDRPRTIRLRDEWVEMDPRVWNANMDATINVGLGTGSRDRDMQMLGVVQNTQVAIVDRFSASGMVEEAIDMLPKMVSTAVKIAESAGLKNPETFFPDVSEDQIEALKKKAAAMAAQPDPKVKAEQEKAAAQMQIDVQKAQLDAQIEREKMQNDIMLKREQMAGELQLKREQLQAELMLKASLSREEMAIKREAGFYKTDKMASTKTSRVNMGGQPG